MSDEIRSDQSASIGKLAAALAKAQGSLDHAVRDCKNDYLKSSYASLASCWDACRPVLAENELAVVQAGVGLDAGSGVIVTTTLIHSSGEWMRSRLWANLEKTAAVDVVAAVTYLRRAGLSAIVGISVETGPETTPAQQSSSQPPNSMFPEESDGKSPYQHERGPEDSATSPAGPVTFGAQAIIDHGTRTYGPMAWGSKRPAAALAVSDGRTPEINELTQEEMRVLSEELNKRETEGVE